MVLGPATSTSLGKLLVAQILWPCEVKVIQSCLTVCDPMNYIVHGILQARILKWVAFPFSSRFSQPRSPALQVDSLPAEPQEKPRNTGVSSLSLPQWIFPTQELNRGLLHCRWILHQLSYQRSHVIALFGNKNNNLFYDYIESRCAKCFDK